MVAIPKKYQTALFMGAFIVVLVTVVSIVGVFNGKESEKKRTRQDSSLDPQYQDNFPVAVDPVGTVTSEELEDDLEFCRTHTFVSVNVGVSNLDLVNGNYKLKVDATPCGDLIDHKNPTVGKSIVLGTPIRFSLDSKIFNFSAGNPIPTQEFGASFDTGGNVLESCTSEGLLIMCEDINNYPFDKYAANDLYIEASYFDKSTNRTDPVSLPLMVFFNAGLLTYSVTKDKLENLGGEIPPSYLTINLGFKVKRSLTTIFFSGLIMAIMWALSLLAVFLAVTLWISGRKVEPPTIAFAIALIFALPGIRNTQPGTPPIGCTADVVSFFWAMVLSAITASLLLLNYIVKYNFDPALQPKDKNMEQAQPLQPYGQQVFQGRPVHG
ncbi:hypothetical protein HDU97_010288 [Phlyctochytrium planicorne]|nr:hypothetical protein HDU97_010288 [Phlyctochytrium planicorne]